MALLCFRLGAGSRYKKSIGAAMEEMKCVLQQRLLKLESECLKPLSACARQRALLSARAPKMQVGLRVEMAFLAKPCMQK